MDPQPGCNAGGSKQLIGVTPAEMAGGDYGASNAPDRWAESIRPHPMLIPWRRRSGQAD